MKQNKHFIKSIVFWIYKTFNMIIILKGTMVPRTLEKINVFHLMLSLCLMKRLRNYYTMLRMILVMPIRLG